MSYIVLNLVEGKPRQAFEAETWEAAVDMVVQLGTEQTDVSAAEIRAEVEETGDFGSPCGLIDIYVLQPEEWKNKAQSDERIANAEALVAGRVELTDEQAAIINDLVEEEYLKIESVFKCPSCGHNRIEEIMSGVTVSSVVTSVGPGGDTDYGDDSHGDGTVDRYQCVNCGWTVPGGITDTGELYEWLKALPKQ